MDLDKEMAELDDVLDQEMESIDEETDEATTDEASEETSDEEAETEEAPETSDKEVEVSAELEEVDVPEVDERYNQLLDQINTLQGQLKDNLPKEDVEIVEELVDYMKDVSLDDLDAKALNKIFNQISRNAIDRAQETYVKQIPGMIGTQIENKMSSQEIVSQFYSANTDLKNVRNVVKACASQVSEENPEWSIEQVLKESALKTRETLGMPKFDVEDLPSSSKAAFAKGSSGVRNKTEKLSALQQEIDEL